MARVDKNGIISGKVNGMIYYNRNGKQCVKGMCANPTDPQTIAQLTQRDKQKLAAAFLRCTRYLIKIGYQKSQKSTPAHEFMSHLVKEAVKGVYPNQYIDYSLCRISRGKIPAPAEITVEKQYSSLSLSWKADLRHAESLKTDHLVVLIINLAGESFIDYKLATRQDESATLNLPESFNDKVHAWGFYHNPDKFPFESREKVSDSIYLGLY